MPLRDVNPPVKASQGCMFGACLFLFCFSALFVYLMVFQIDDVRRIPTNGNITTWIIYSISQLLSLAVISVFVFANYFIINTYFGEGKGVIQFTDKKNIKVMFGGVICFAVIAGKIVFLVLSNIIVAMLKLISEDSSSIVPWIAMIFFIGIGLGFFLIFRWILIKFSKANQAMETGKADVFKGKVKNKTKVRTMFDYEPRGRNLAPYRYGIELDSGKIFENVLEIYYEQVQIGQTIEVHAIPFVGEILHVYVKE